MMTTEIAHTKVTTQHRAKHAYVYIRQSSLAQVTQHRESTELQYHLIERAVALGWPRERVLVIDDDLGKSGASAQDRPGFQRLLAEIGLARVGLVLSLDASRLARNNRDWYQLLDLCAVFGTLIADGEQLYNPGLYQDRMLLGRSGMMSEAELHGLRLRLHAGALNKAQRGELRLPLPIGLTRLPGGEVILNPDEEIQQRVHLVFDLFGQLQSARAVVRYLRREGLPLPARPLRGPAPHPVCWQAASNSRVLSILKNPAYAGAYVYGRRTTDPARRRPGRPRSGSRLRPMAEWPVLLRDHYPAYIGWAEFLANQARLASNQNRYEHDKHGVPRQGQALLQGLVRCGMCGARMGIRYSDPQGQYPVYTCTYANSRYGEPRCQEVRGLGLDAEVERLVLNALAPDRIALALSALEELEREEQALRRQWQLRLERAHYEAERAARQYNLVEPEDRLVARTLERRWEAKLRAVEHLERDYQQWQRQHRLVLSEADRVALLALGEDLPGLWRAASTTAADRKQILRLALREVIVDQHRQPGQVWFKVNWQTGATSEHRYRRCVRSYREHPELEALEERVRQLHAEAKMDYEIAAALNAAGFKSARGRRFTNQQVWLLRQQWGLPTVQPTRSSRLQWADGCYTVEGAAQEIGVFSGTIYKWIRQGKLESEQLGKGTPWKIRLTQEEIEQWRTYVQRVRRSKKEVS